MSARKLERTIPGWPKQSFADRALLCAGFLRCHGLLSDSERERVHRRMLKLQEKEAQKR